jgi:metal-responsive CopG/Arc/MetJ family transcriptional regulator
MTEDIKLRLPPNLIVKLDRRAARIGVTRSEHITSILRASLESGRPVILEADTLIEPRGRNA